VDVRGDETSIIPDNSGSLLISHPLPQDDGNARAWEILIASQHDVPDTSITATYVTAIAQALAVDHRVIVLSGSPNGIRGE